MSPAVGEGQPEDSNSQNQLLDALPGLTLPGTLASEAGNRFDALRGRVDILPAGDQRTRRPDSSQVQLHVTVRPGIAMPGSSLRKAIRVCTAILLTAVCTAAPVAVGEAFLVLFSFGNHTARWWLIAFSAGVAVGVAYQLLAAYNSTRPPLTLTDR